MKVLADARQKLDIPWENPDNNERAEYILNFDNRTTLDTRLFLAYAPSMYCLWKDSAIKRAFERRREFQLSDSVQYFLDNIENIARSVRYFINLKCLFYFIIFFDINFKKIKINVVFIILFRTIYLRIKIFYMLEGLPKASMNLLFQ